MYLILERQLSLVQLEVNLMRPHKFARQACLHSITQDCSAHTSALDVAACYKQAMCQTHTMVLTTSACIARYTGIRRRQYFGALYNACMQKVRKAVSSNNMLCHTLATASQLIRSQDTQG